MGLTHFFVLGLGCVGFGILAEGGGIPAHQVAEVFRKTRVSPLDPAQRLAVVRVLRELGSLIGVDLDRPVSVGADPIPA